MSATKLPPIIVLTIVGLISISLFVSLNLNPTSDITWRMHVANSTLAGKEIYRDLIETNPPLWFWSSLIWAQAAKLLGLKAYVVMCIGIHFIAVVAVVLLDRLIKQTLNQHERSALLIGFVVSYLFVTIGEIGQREQALLVGATLWIALENMRLERKYVPLWLVIIVTLFGAYGFALKHFFIAIPVAIELWLLISLKRDYRPLRVETTVLAALAIIYAIAVLYFAPLFLTRIIPLVTIAYDGFSLMMGLSCQQRFLRSLLNCAFILLPFIAVFFAKTRPRLTTGLYIMLLLASIIMVIQFKGWRYHMLAAHGTAVMLMSLAIGTALSRKHDRNRREILMAFACFGSAAYLLFLFPFLEILKYRGQIVSADLRRIVSAEPSSKRIAILSVAPEHAFYLLDRTQHTQWSRHYGMWMLPGLQAPNSNPRADVRRLEEYNRVRREFVADLFCMKPDIIITEKGIIKLKQIVEIDTLKFVMQDPRFATWFSAAYKPAEQFDIFTIWRLKGALPLGDDCLRAQ